MTQISSTLAPDAASCPLCHDSGGLLLLQTARWRLVRVLDDNFPAFYRLIWQDHVAEFSSLGLADRQDCIEAVVAIERVLLAALQPTKINLASFGNVVPHLHWHVVARFDWDSHFPQPVWGQAQRTPEPAAVQRLALPLNQLDALVVAELTRPAAP